MNKKLSIITKAETHLILYILLLITTPFLLLQNYLQSLIGELSNLSYNILEVNVPVTVIIAVLIIFITLYFTYKKLNKLRIISWVVIVVLFWIGQKSTDYYFNHKFYELQYNWHFFAYAIFAYLNYRVLSEKKIKPQKIIALTFIYTIAISTFDEAVQIPLSNRIFDLGDIAKDLWGSMIGLFFIFFILEDGLLIKDGWRIRNKKLKNYFTNPLSLLIIEFGFAYVFMVSSALLTSSEYIINLVLISIIIVAIIVGITHISQLRLWRIILIIVFSTLIITQTFFIVKYSDENIIYNKSNLLIYKGLPIIFFDLLIFPDGSFRLVDKKKVFNKRDQNTIFKTTEDILIIASGTDGSGGNGFPQKTKVQFIYNETKKKGVQIIILENDEACTKFNNLKDEGKKPSLIFHNN